MGVEKSDILWQIANRTVQDEEHIDTGIALFDTNHDFSIAFDITADRTFNGRRLLRISTPQYFNYSAYSSSIFIFIYNNKTVGTIGDVTAGRHRFVIIRNAENNLIWTKYRKNNGTPNTKSKTVEFKRSTDTLTLGGHPGEYPGDNGLPNGTIHKMVIYNRILSDAEIDSWLDV